MHAFADSVLTFLAAHPEWLVVIAFAMGAVETMIVVSLFFPSMLIILGAGALVATGQIPFWPLFLGASLGAIIGSSLAWWLGWHYHEPFLRWTPISKRRKSIDRVRAMLRKWGLWVVFFGHFVPPLRGPIFLLVGASRLPFRPFLPITTAGSIVWGYVMPRLGQMGGHAFGWLF